MTQLDFYNPDRINQMLKMADHFYKAGCFGSDVQNAEQAFVKLQMGAEIGMQPMESLNSLYIIKGKVTVWGTAQGKILKNAGFKIKYEDQADNAGNPFACAVTVTRGDESYGYTATINEIKNGQAAKFAPKEKLRYHALSRILRFDLPELLGGNVYTAEEVTSGDWIEGEVVNSQKEANDKEFNDLMLDLEKSKTLNDLKNVKSRLVANHILFTDAQKTEFKELYAMILGDLGLQKTSELESEPEEKPVTGEELLRQKSEAASKKQTTNETIAPSSVIEVESVELQPEDDNDSEKGDGEKLVFGQIPPKTPRFLKN